MRYIFLDKILKLRAYEEILAVKHLTISEDFFADHFPGFPVMPGALQIEAAAQAVSALLEISNGLSRKAYLLMVDKAKFRQLVRPGQELLIKAKIESIDENSAQVYAQITESSVKVMDCTLLMGLGDINMFYPTKTREIIEAYYDYWMEGVEINKNYE